ncbi:MAG TPA: NAD(P)-binding domain-containing protein, partial [Thermoanaerobaculia bacterium]|nr:NAD(P)-binding domain-containing protein [Thermoanaerobaculia bacterium]
MNALPPLRDLTVALAGPGRVGTSLARWAVAAGARLVAVGTSPSGRGGELARELGAEAVPAGELASAGLGLLLVAVPDPALPAV